jgi:hypothetical protein
VVYLVGTRVKTIWNLAVIQEGMQWLLLDARLLSETPLGDTVQQRFGAPFLNVHRGDLLAVLAGAVPADRIYLRRRCHAVVESNHRVVIRFDVSQRWRRDTTM